MKDSLLEDTENLSLNHSRRSHFKVNETKYPYHYHIKLIYWQNYNSGSDSHGNCCLHRGVAVPPSGQDQDPWVPWQDDGEQDEGGGQGLHHEVHQQISSGICQIVSTRRGLINKAETFNNVINTFTVGVKSQIIKCEICFLLRAIFLIHGAFNIQNH